MPDIKESKYSIGNRWYLLPGINAADVETRRYVCFPLPLPFHFHQPTPRTTLWRLLWLVLAWQGSQLLGSAHVRFANVVDYWQHWTTLATEWTQWPRSSSLRSGRSSRWPCQYSHLYSTDRWQTCRCRHVCFYFPHSQITQLICRKADL